MYLSLNVLVQTRGRRDKLGDVLVDQVVHFLYGLGEGLGLGSGWSRGWRLGGMFGDTRKLGSTGRGRKMDSSNIGDGVPGLIERRRRGSNVLEAGGGSFESGDAGQ
jgi:hypothetical protein